MKVFEAVKNTNRSGINIFCGIIWKIWSGYEKICNIHLIPFSFKIQWNNKYTKKDRVYKKGSQCILIYPYAFEFR